MCDTAEDRDCTGCGDTVQYLSTDGMCDGCVADDTLTELPGGRADLASLAEPDAGAFERAHSEPDGRDS